MIQRAIVVSAATEADLGHYDNVLRWDERNIYLDAGRGESAVCFDEDIVVHDAEHWPEKEEQLVAEE